ncbi:DinB family protein [Falsibacillus pallidus]|uniref:DinB family protein n=1 Tax=Falsibacillus pallidus TaxID=493781 RepID=A0A370GSV0_9BACI|nr:DinB family protein [Falsibacillus pallidus]RDI45604.1 DinB family protein [Falsibacillus pallidus]
MSRKELLLNVLSSTFDQESWYAPLKPSIEGTTAEQACWKPTGEAAKSIWQNVNHIMYYKERLVANLEGSEWPYKLSGNENFDFTKQSNVENEWKKVIERVEDAHLKLKSLLMEKTDEELSELEGELMDIFLHDAYHTGQIMQIRKLQGAWPSNR